jgi:GTP cyclohydrolase II
MTESFSISIPTPSAASFENMPLLSPTISFSSGAETPQNQPPPEIPDKVRQNLPIHSEKDLPIVRCIARARIPTTQGPEIFLHLYENNVDQKEHLAIVFGEDIRSSLLFQQRPNDLQQDRMTRGAYVGKLAPGRTTADFDPKTGVLLEFDMAGALIRKPQLTFVTDATVQHSCLTRIHSECYTGETAWLARCDCGEQFDEAGRIMGVEGHGCIVYLRQEGRGIGLGEKLKAYNLQDLGADTVQANLILRHPADGRSFLLATAILKDLGLFHIRLLTNNPDKILAVEGKDRDVRVVERVPMIPLAWRNAKDGIKLKEIEGYLSTKIERMGHLLEKPIKF